MESTPIRTLFRTDKLVDRKHMSSKETKKKKKEQRVDSFKHFINLVNII